MPQAGGFRLSQHQQPCREKEEEAEAEEGGWEVWRAAGSQDDRRVNDVTSRQPPLRLFLLRRRRQMKQVNGSVV